MLVSPRVEASARTCPRGSYHLARSPLVHSGRERLARSYPVGGAARSCGDHSQTISSTTSMPRHDVIRARPEGIQNGPAVIRQRQSRSSGAEILDRESALARIRSQSLRCHITSTNRASALRRERRQGARPQTRVGRYRAAASHRSASIALQSPAASCASGKPRWRAMDEYRR